MTKIAAALVRALPAFFTLTMPFTFACGDSAPGGAGSGPHADDGSFDKEASTSTERADLVVDGSMQSWDCPAAVTTGSYNSNPHLMISFGPCGKENRLVVVIAIETGKQTCGSNAPEFTAPTIFWNEARTDSPYTSATTLHSGVSGRCTIEVKDVGTTSGFIEATISGGLLANLHAPPGDSGLRSVEGTFRVRKQ